MKIVLAEKVSPATLAVFQAEPGWKVITHDQIKDGLAAEIADADGLVVRSAVQVDDALLSSAPGSIDVSQQVASGTASIPGHGPAMDDDGFDG